MKELNKKQIIWIKIRMISLILVTIFGFFWLGKTAYSLQISQHNKLTEMAEEQYLRRIVVPAKRGIIYDRNNNELAVTTLVDSVYANTREIQNVDQIAEQLSSILEMDAEQIKRKLRSRGSFVWLKRYITPEQSRRIRGLNLIGINIIKEGKRFYPNRELAAHVIGFAGLDSVGLEGIELSFDSQLKGISSDIIGLRDAEGKLVFSDDLLLENPVEGNSVVLTIDRSIQYIVEQELNAGINLYEAQSGSVIVLDPRTGEILAMANYPTFDPNLFSQFHSSNWRNRAIHDIFEPGSTIKIFTLAAALNLGIISTNEEFFCENGRYNIFDYTIHDAHRDGWLSITEILQRSSNIGISKIALLLGKERFYNYLRRFGFGQRTDILLPGETRGRLPYWRNWYDVDLATIAFGQGIGVSNLQLAMATSIIANHGRLIEPFIVKSIISPEGQIVARYESNERRQVVSRYVADLVTDMMTTVTEEGGTGIEANLEGFIVAGKTGTAQQADVVNGGYQQDAWVASFIGFVPADDPRIAITVVINQPTLAHYGGNVAGPIFRRIASQILRYLGVNSPIRNNNISYRRQNNSQRTTTQRSENNTSNSEIRFGLDIGGVIIPDWTGKTLREVSDSANRLGILLKMEGTGLVTSQNPQAGNVVEKGSEVQVQFQAPHDNINNEESL